jgi:hypothetical protein
MRGVGQEPATANTVAAASSSVMIKRDTAWSTLPRLAVRVAVAYGGSLPSGTVSESSAPLAVIAAALGRGTARLARGARKPGSFPR